MLKTEWTEQGFINEPAEAGVDLKKEIRRLCEEKGAIILAHYYTTGDIQDVADFVGDSLALARKAAETDAKIMVMCGVHFMAETCKLLSPDKVVLCPDLNAGCSLADSCKAEDLKKFKDEHPGYQVISYVNTTAAVKALTDVVVTSGNAKKVVDQLPKDGKFIFGPDYNLGNYINEVTGRQMLLWNGGCHVHERFSVNKIMALKNPKDMSKMIWTWIFASFCCLLVMFGGLYMRAINPSLKVADNAVIEYVKLFHPVISTILSVAIVAALMSTACGLILVITTCISNDLFLKTLVKHGIINMEEEKAERFAYGLTKILPAIIGAISLYLVFNPPPFMGVMVWIGISGVSAATLAPLIFALFLPKIANSKAAIIGAIVGEGVYFYLYLIAHIERSVMAAGAWGVLVSFVVMFVLGNLWKSDLPEAQAQK